MAREISSISRFGLTEPFELQVSRGQVYKHTPLIKYGYSPLIVNVNETIWDAGGIYSYPSSALSMTVTSASGATDAGVQVTVIGLDANWEEVTQEVTLNGSGTATLSTSLIRVYRAYVSGSSSPAGDITIANGGTTYAQITAGENQTLMALYTVPAGKTFYFHRGTANFGTDLSGAYLTIRFVQRLFGKVFRTAMKLDLISGREDFNFSYPQAFPEKTDLEVRGVCSKNQANAVSATFQGVLVDNG
jgi:hypothetical protein